ncbi:MAG: DUF1501 domain-containing protein, partial [Verrucomicrobia bacterium]|nr:DUF1501 domain-containing protein [Verrucomicrobiota bacterium]
MEDVPNFITRRKFIRQAACAAVGTAALTNTIFDLRLVGAAMAQGVPEDYKALICLFLYGGNDANNLLIPLGGTAYDQYAAARGNLALAPETLRPIDTAYGLHPSCGGLQQLYANSKLAILANVGTLVYPMTKAEYAAKSVPRPPQLFSHNDQQVQWQTSIPDQPPKTGWGGRCADLLYSLNAGAQVSMSIALSGFNTFEVGNLVQQYQVSTSGSIGLSSVSGTRLQAMKDILALPNTNLMEKAFGDVTERAIANHELLTAALGSIPDPAGFPPTALGNQLKMIGKLIAARNALSMKRQIFFCSVGGYDTHGEQINAHAGLLGELSDSLKAIYDYTAALGLANQVTTFTASDFGRTFPSNGIGSDHGWGSHQLIVGG